MELTGELLGEIEGDALTAVEGEFDGILEAVRRQMFPNSAIPKDVRDIALAVARKSSGGAARTAAQSAARATAQLVKERTVGVETKYQTFFVLFNTDVAPPGAPINANVTYSLDITPDTSYDIVSGMFVIMNTPDPAPAQIPAGTVFTPFIGLQNDQTIVKDPSPRELFMVDRNGTTPVSDRFTRLELDLKITTGRNLKILSRFVTPPTSAIAVTQAAGTFFGYSITLELSRAKRKIR